MKKFRKANIKRIISAAVVSALIASGVGYTFVSSAANTITLASSGRFEYDADGNGTINGAAGDIILDSDDLVALKDAVTGLNSSLTAISTKAYGADGVPNYTGQLKDASGNLISGDPDDLESKYYSYQTSHSYTNTQYNDYVSTHSYTDEQYEALKSSSIPLVKTSVGYGIANGMQVVAGSQIDEGGGTIYNKYLVWSGRYTKEQLMSRTWTPTVTSGEWDRINQQTGFMGIVTGSSSHGHWINNWRYVYVDWLSFTNGTISVNYTNYISNSDFTLVPLA